MQVGVQGTLPGDCSPRGHLPAPLSRTPDSKDFLRMKHTGVVLTQMDRRLPTLLESINCNLIFFLLPTSLCLASSLPFPESGKLGLSGISVIRPDWHLWYFLWINSDLVNRCWLRRAGAAGVLGGVARLEGVFSEWTTFCNSSSSV